MPLELPKDERDELPEERPVREKHGLFGLFGRKKPKKTREPKQEAVPAVAPVPPPAPEPVLEPAPVVTPPPQPEPPHVRLNVKPISWPAPPPPSRNFVHPPQSTMQFSAGTAPAGAGAKRTGCAAIAEHAGGCRAKAERAKRAGRTAGAEHAGGCRAKAERAKCAGRTAIAECAAVTERAARRFLPCAGAIAGRTGRRPAEGRLFGAGAFRRGISGGCPEIGAPAQGYAHAILAGIMRISPDLLSPALKRKRSSARGFAFSVNSMLFSSVNVIQ